MSTSDGLCIGIDLGGTHIKGALGRPRELPVWTTHVPSRAEAGREAVEQALLSVALAAREAATAQGHAIVGACIATPGTVDPKTGRVPGGTANLPDWGNADLMRLFGEQLSVPVVVENDANAAAFAEAGWGAGRGAKHVLVVTVGTGVGGGAVVDGRLLRGMSGAAMEIGHVPAPLVTGVIDGAPPRCRCGRYGCIEAYVGGWALRAAWARALARDDDTVTVRALIEHARGGHADARQILSDAATRLGHGLRAAVHLLDPEVVILGGGVIDGYPDFVPRVEAVLDEFPTLGPARHAAVRKVEFGNQAGMLGAIGLAAAVSTTTSCLA